eukprot:GHVR01057796.1.p2 GENE.GHVR01057796.1~~GHVR01057796.1.p2  ORF type:complete len:100 (+),score=16.03 GHVR01057796.1:749-1048(+)
MITRGKRRQTLPDGTTDTSMTYATIIPPNLNTISPMAASTTLADMINEVNLLRTKMQEQEQTSLISNMSRCDMLLNDLRLLTPKQISFQISHAESETFN